MKNSFAIVLALSIIGCGGEDFSSQQLVIPHDGGGNDSSDSDIPDNIITDSQSDAPSCNCAQCVKCILVLDANNQPKDPATNCPAPFNVDGKVLLCKNEGFGGSTIPESPTFLQPFNCPLADNPQVCCGSQLEDQCIALYPQEVLFPEL